MKLSKFLKILCVLTAFSMLSACASTASGTPPANETAAADGGSEAANGGSSNIIRVGTMGTYFPFSHTDAASELTGYDVDVMRMLDEKMKDVEIEFVTGPFDTLFLEMDAGRIDMIANQIAKNPDREAKYLFSEDGYIYVQTKLVVSAEDNTSISMEDMTGQTMGGITGDYFTELMENYNAENGNPFTLQYYEGEYVGIFTDLSTGRIQGTLNDTTVVNGYANSMGLGIKCVGDVIESSYSYFCIRNDGAGQTIKNKIDAALKEALNDGSLAEISMKWFGEDFTK